MSTPSSDGYCPSGRPVPDALVIGLVGRDGVVRHLQTPMTVRDEFGPGRDEARFRFAETCAQERCRHWAERRCGLVDALLVDPPPPGDLARCGLRSRCVWFAQRGAAACAACRHVAHDPEPVFGTSA